MEQLVGTRNMRLNLLTDNELLQALKNERTKFTHSNKNLMQQLVNELISRGVYSVKSGIGLDALAMVESWGEDWHLYREPLECPHCGADLRDPKRTSVQA